MEPRIKPAAIPPGLFKAMMGLELYLSNCGMEKNLLHMVKLRASQINGCAYCIDMHWKDAKHVGESDQRLYGLDAWNEFPFYTPRERAAFEWTEAVTLITEGHVPDAVYARVREQFNEKELADLTFAISTINAWNRLNIAFRTEGGKYKIPEKPG